MVLFLDYPAPEEVLRLGPPRNVARVHQAQDREVPCSSAQLELLEKKVLAEVARQILSGRHLGTSVCVYLRGRQVLHVLAGVFRSCTPPPSTSGSSDPVSCWRPVDEHTLFMAYSVAKGVTAMALLSLVDRGLVKYEEKVVELWPEFGRGGGHGKSKQDITIGDAVSHRAGLGSLQPFSLGALWSCGLGSDWRQAWKSGEEFIESMVPEFEVGAYARYHPVSFSWLMGGILQRILLRHRRRRKDSAGEGGASGDSNSDDDSDDDSDGDEGSSDRDCPHWKSVSDIVKNTVGAACGCGVDLFIGLPPRPPAALLSRVALLEPLRPWRYQYPNPMSELRAVDSLLNEEGPLQLHRLPAWLRRLLAAASYILFLLLAVVEGMLFCAIGNSNVWRGICLPSSNGYFTSQAVAVMYGALANGGVVEIEVEVTEEEASSDTKIKNNKEKVEGAGIHTKNKTAMQAVRVFRKATVDKVFSEAEDPSTAVPMYDCHADRSSWGRHSKGFSPWPLPTLHGREHMASTLGHQGMGGCSSFGCRDTGLAVCVLRNVYDPLVISEGAVKLDDGLLSQIIREVLKC